MNRLSWALVALMIVAADGRLSRGAYEGQFDKEHPFNIDGFNSQPRRIKTVPPKYPAEAQSGTVVLRVKIDPEGHVEAVTVVRGVAGATEAAVKAVQQWEYTPTQLNGEPIWVLMTVNVPCPWRDD